MAIAERKVVILCRQWLLVAALLFSALISGLAISPIKAHEHVDGTTIAHVEARAINALRLIGTAERARLIVDLSEPTQFAYVSLDEPLRIAVDVRAGTLNLDQIPPPPKNGFVLEYAIEKLGADRIRIMLQLEAAAQVAQAYVLDKTEDQPARLVVDFARDELSNFVARARADANQSLALTQQDTALEATNLPQNGPGAGDAVAAEGQDEGTNGSANVAEPIRPLILIDPGHGGADGGAVARNGQTEKEIVLDFSKKLSAILTGTGKFDVALTRDEDVFLSLDQRVQIARENKADLFVSIHADAFSDPTIRGAAVYTRDEKATDVLDEVLAESENQADIIGGAVQVDANPAVVDLLVDLMRREMRRQAYLAGDAVSQQLRPAVPTRRFTLRQADFYVLQSPDVPSFLIELGFMSNAADEQNLTDPVWQERAAQAVARGIVQYFDEQARL